MMSGRSGEEKPHCQSSLGRTEVSSGMKTLMSCKERRLLPESGSLDPNMPWKRHTQQGEKAEKKKEETQVRQRKKRKNKGGRLIWERKGKQKQYNYDGKSQ